MDGIACGLYWEGSVVSRHGIHVDIYREPHHTYADVRKAKTWLLNEHDVVSSSVIRVKSPPPGKKEAVARSED